MRKSIKISLCLLAGLIISIIAVLSFVIATFDNDNYRKGLISLVENLTDCQIEIDTPFTTEISLKPSFSASTIRLFIPGRPEPIKLQNLKLKITSTALIRGRLGLDVAGSITDPESLKWLLPEELYAINSIELKAQLVIAESELNLKKLKVSGRNAEGLEIDINGNGLIEDFSALQPFSKLDLAIDITSPDSHSLKGFLPDNLPELGPVKGSLRLIATSSSALAAEAIDLDFGRTGELSIKAVGRIAKIPVDPDIINTGIDLKLALQTPKSSVIGRLIDQPLPEVGPVAITTQFLGSKKESQIKNLDIHAGNSGGLEFKVRGNLSLGDSSDDLAKILQEIDLETAISAPTGTELPTIDKASPANLKVPQSGPLTSTFKLHGNLEKISLSNFSASFGKTTVTADVNASLTGKRPLFTGKVASRIFYLDDFLTPAADPPAKTPQKLKDDKTPDTPVSPASENTPLLSRQPLPRDWLHLFDCDINLSIDKVVGFQSGLRNLVLAVKIEDGKLLADPASFISYDGYAETSLLIDDSNILPIIKFKGVFDDLDMIGLLTSFDLSSPVSGKLTMHADLFTQGLSLHELAVNLNGPFEVVLEEGKVPSRLAKMIAIDLFGWSYDQILMQDKYTEISCGIIALKAEEGILESRVFMLESPNLRITGAGTINLESETLDITIYPKEKRKFWATATPINITGPLQNPKVFAIPVKTAALLYGGALLAPQIFLPAIGLEYLWGIVSKDEEGAKSPCFEYLQQHPQGSGKTNQQKVPSR